MFKLVEKYPLNESRTIYRATVEAPMIAKAARPGLKAALDYMRDDDVLVVTRLDRLGRTALDTLRTIDELAKQDVAVIVLKPELDSRTKEGRLMVTIMSGLAEFERDLLIERTQAGLSRAKAEGKKLGRPAALTAQQQQAVRDGLAAGQSVSSLARQLGASRQTVMRVRADVGGG